MDQALGLIETRGLVAAIEAADAMVKAADVKIISKEKVTGALIVIKVIGETAAVKSAVDAGAASAQRVGELVSAHVIPRPDDQIDPILYDSLLKSEKIKEDKEKVGEIKSKIKSVTSKTISTKVSKIESGVKNEAPAVSKEVKKAEASDLKTPLKSSDNKTEKAKSISNSQKVPSLAELEILNVHSLRKIARGFENFPIKGREISKANRGQLLDYFKELHK